MIDPSPEGPAADAAEALRAAFPSVPAVAVVVGSGLGAIVEALDEPVSVRFEELRGLPGAGVAGHAGRFVWGRLDGVPTLVQAGRLHLYEGHAEEVVIRPVRILASLGVGALVLTNAAGGIHPRLEPGAIVRIDDVVNLTFRTPLVGPVAPGEPRFPDMSRPFDPALVETVRAAATARGIRLEEGSYAAVLGPQYETAAEIRALRRLGVDLIGMSTVPEVIAAAAAGLPCVALSLVTNRATGLDAGALSHAEVLEVGRAAGERMRALLGEVVRRIAPSGSGAEQPEVPRR